MNVFQQFLEALESLAANKTRSALTMLGIIIGVAAVISMLAIGDGVQASISGEINSIGSNLIFVMPGAEDVTNSRPLTQGDADALADPLVASSIAKAAPALQGQAEATYGSESTTTTILGITPAYAELRNLVTVEGEFFNESSVSGRSAVAVLGSETAENLFGRSSGVTGEQIRIKGQPFQVIGVLETKGGSGMGGSQDDQILVPITTARARLLSRSSADQVDMILVQAVDADQVPQASDEITAILQLRHRSPVGVSDFTLMKQQDMLDIAQSITGVLTIFLGGIAAISLLVGGIGIMNIMLVSVTERTREIGLRKALGARWVDILLQFLIESAMLSLIGGMLGIVLAWVITNIVQRVAVASGTEINPIMGINSILLATLFSAAVGLFFGIYPANRAAKLEPVEALRSE